MNDRIDLNQPAPNFTLEDINGNKISLANYLGYKNVLMVFNRGFF